ncbi:MAG: hypothetical protein LBC90_07775 [Candidatus Adiutrix sp.]|jgi:hypothetical protein|nr:hypothetical protein [Candidatus Adiutrix sp.]
MAVPKKPLLAVAGIVLIAAAAAGFIAYINTAFPEARCEAADHLAAPDELSDCYTCHAKVTPVLAQDWQESKHGALLVKCFVCHGQPDGQGAIPFSVKPSERNICSRCHEPSMNRMEKKFGELQSCNTCHPRHQNPMHRSAFEAVSSNAKTDF